MRYIDLRRPVMTDVRSAISSVPWLPAAAAMDALTAWFPVSAAQSAIFTCDRFPVCPSLRYNFDCLSVVFLGMSSMPSSGGIWKIVSWSCQRLRSIRCMQAFAHLLRPVSTATISCRRHAHWYLGTVGIDACLLH